MGFAKALTLERPIVEKIDAAKQQGVEVLFTLDKHPPATGKAGEKDVYKRQVCFYAQKHTIAIFFGDVIPVADCPNFAKIEEDSLPGFQEVARTAWKNQGQPITFEVENV